MEEQRRDIPSLMQLSAKALRTGAAREMADHLVGPGGTGELTEEWIDAIRETELAHLSAKGRVPREHYNSLLDRPIATPNKKMKPPSCIDGAKLMDCNGRNFRIRVDDSDNLPFWLEIDVPLARLQTWLLTQGIKMTWSVVEDEESKIEVD